MSDVFLLTICSANVNYLISISLTALSFFRSSFANLIGIISILASILVSTLCRKISNSSRSIWIWLKASVAELSSAS
ncbi:hypothetical protein BDD12DRAFT_817438 [Trichophaea hybrida]|nr:hypothetical protein BDD12DRAFT_817438 [Trichophaea hybrida]